MKAYTLDMSHLDDAQIESIEKLIERCKRGEFTAVKTRVNGEWLEAPASWIKHLKKVDAEEVRDIIDKIKAVIPILLNSTITVEQEFLLTYFGSKKSAFTTSAGANKFLEAHLKTLEALL